MKPGPRRQPSAMLTVRVCQAFRAYAERKRETERSQLRAALMERRPACVIYVKRGSYEPARPAARGAAPDPHAGHASLAAGTRVQRPAPLAEYEPEAD
jgi:hypothetical protein